MEKKFNSVIIKLGIFNKIDHFGIHTNIFINVFVNKIIEFTNIFNKFS